MGIDISTIDCINKHRVILQCRYSSITLKRVRSLKYGTSCNKLLKDIRIINGLIGTANRYDTRDLALTTPLYNVRTQEEIKCIIQKAYDILEKHQ